MKKLLSLAIVTVLCWAMASVALARGAPTKNAFTTAAVSVDAVMPTVALRNVPPMTAGYDVICNLSTPAEPRVSNAVSLEAVISAKTRLSTTGDERGFTRTFHRFEARSGPNPAMVARS